MASKNKTLSNAWQKASAANKRSHGKKMWEKHALKNSGGEVDPKGVRDRAKSAISNGPSEGGGKKSSKKKFVRNRPSLGKGKGAKASPAKKSNGFGSGTMVGGRQKFGRGLSLKKAKWMSPVTRGHSREDLNGNQWHSKQDLKTINRVLNDHAAEFYGPDGKSGIFAKLRNDPNAYNKTAHTLNLAMDPTVKKWIDDAMQQNSSHTKRFTKNFFESSFDPHGRKSVKAMKRRAKAMFYTVQFGPDGRAK